MELELSNLDSFPFELVPIRSFSFRSYSSLRRNVKQEGNSLKDLRRMNDLNDLNNYYTVIGTYSIVVIK